MKKSKKLMIAAMAAVTAGVAGAAGTSTFAWFSMNTSVSATGMKLEAKSDNTFLLISSTNNTAAEIQKENVISASLEVSDADAKVYASAPALTEDEVKYLTVSGKKVGEEAITVAGEKVVDDATANAPTNWYTATAAASDNAAMKKDSARQLVSFTNYVIKRTAYLTVASGANSANNLTITPTFSQKKTGTDLAAVKMVVTTSDGGFAVVNSSSKKTDIKGNNTALSDKDVLTVNMYLYYDGNESVVYTNNAANLTGAEITVSFGVDAIKAK